LKRIGWLLGLVLVISACGGGGEPGPAVVTFQTPDGSTFKIAVEDQAMLDRFKDALAGDGHAGIPNGKLAAGDGGVNTGHQWHLTEVELVDMAIEVCDGNASDIDEDLDYWLNTVGQYCPWDARVTAVDG
jgi:hypothetical protein